MTQNQQITFIPLEQLRLDVDNPRLPKLFATGEKTREEIINKLLADDNLIELMLAIRTEGFFIGEALLVVQDGDHYVVVEGNRRLAALELLKKPDIANRHKQKIAAVLAEAGKEIDEVPCIVFPRRDQITQYLGYRHVTGIKPWSLSAKARYLTSLLPGLSATSLDDQARELAKIIGSKSPHVKNLLLSYRIYQKIEDDGFYDIPGLNETSFYFNYIKDSLSREHIRDFMKVNLEAENPLEALDKDDSNLKELMHWFFEKNAERKTLVIGDSESLTHLNQVLSKPEALAYFRETGKLKDALKFVEQSEDNFHNQIEAALETLKIAQGYMHNIDTHYVSDTDILSEIIRLSKSMRGNIRDKMDDED